MAYPTLLGWHQTRYADVMYTSFQSCDNSSFSYNSWMPTMDAWLLQTPWLWRLSSYGADAGFTFLFHNIRFWYSVNPVGDTGDGRGTRQFGVHDGDSGWLLEKVNKIFFYLHIYIQMYLFVISSHYGLCSGVPTGTKTKIGLPRGSEFKKCWERKLSKKVHSTSFTAMKINKAVIYPLLQCSFVRSSHQCVGQQEHYSW